MRSLLLLATFGAAAVTLTRAAQPPYDASLGVHFGWEQGTRGSGVLREDITRAAIDALSDRGCFRDIQSGEQASLAPLQLDVEFWDLIEETEFDDSMAERVDPSRPKPALHVTATFSIFVGWNLRAGEASIAHKRFKIERHRRPLTEYEDPTVWVRNEVIEAVGHELGRAVCSVSRKKIDAARAAAR